jgi:hypothetical protein
MRWYAFWAMAWAIAFSVGTHDARANDGAWGAQGMWGPEQRSDPLSLGGQTPFPGPACLGCGQGGLGGGGTTTVGCGGWVPKTPPTLPC